MTADNVLWVTLLRLGFAVFCGGVIGLERGRKRRPAGFRTHMLVCLGAALAMLISQYLSMMEKDFWSVLTSFVANTDVSRLGAQVINGIGFLGAGTIIVTGRQEVKGLTTAAGLWASACMGLTIGAGFVEGAFFGCILISFTIIVFSRLERFIVSRVRNRYAKKVLIIVDGFNYSRKNEQKEYVFCGSLSCVEQIFARVGRYRPVVVLARAVYACIRLFVEQTNKSVALGNFLHIFHNQKILVNGKICRNVYRG
jgi:uncharacterized membrane protein YhiD involved in acid resistance